MSANYPPVEVKVWGDFASFTRPETKLERVSYEVPTPSAARGILESIFWKPQMRWRVREVHVLNEIKHFSVLRNEVKSRMSDTGDGIDIVKDRSQRHTLCLRDVAYIIKADVWLQPGASDEDGKTVDAAKYRDQFRRRVERGECFARPVLGCREFAAHFAPVTESEEAIPVTKDLGFMLFDISYGTSNAPAYFHARLEQGVLRVPAELYDQLPAGGRP